MLQRRKKYKNRRILGYKTLAVGTLDMTEVGWFYFSHHSSKIANWNSSLSGCRWGFVDFTKGNGFFQVLQRSVDQELAMYASPKEKESVVAKISIVALSTQPVNSASGKESLEDGMSINWMGGWWIDAFCINLKYRQKLRRPKLWMSNPNNRFI
jgi:hypothetical protein